MTLHIKDNNAVRFVMVYLIGLNGGAYLSGMCDLIHSKHYVTVCVQKYTQSANICIILKIVTEIGLMYHMWKFQLYRLDVW